MATKTQSATPFSRLSRLGLGFGARTDPKHSVNQEAGPADDEDWYIPYNGPYEPPKSLAGDVARDSWGDMLSGWLTEGKGFGEAQSALDYEHNDDAEGDMASRVRGRVLSNASHFTMSSGNIDPSRKSFRSSTARAAAHPRMPTSSFINLDRAGGVGDTPMPAERNPRYMPSDTRPTSSGGNANRASMASIWSFGKKRLSHSASMEQLGTSTAITGARGRANTSVTPAAVVTSPLAGSTIRHRASSFATQVQRPDRVSEESPDEYYQSYYSTLRQEESQPTMAKHEEVLMRSHPYANAVHSTSVALGTGKGKTRFLDPSKLSITLLDPRGQNRVPAYLKPSPRNSIKPSLSTPNLRSLPKGKQRWLSPETWYDTLILPRPRFTMKLISEEGGGRVESSPGIPVVSPRSTTDVPVTSPPEPTGGALGRSRSMGNMISAAAPADSQRGIGTSSAVAAAKDEKKPKALRPRSFAWDDMALPSPVPSLAKVLEEGKQLEEERKLWQSKATRSFQNKRARSVSRARTKSVGASERPRTGVRSKNPDSAFDFLAERTLLGNQARPPTVHIHGPITPKSPRNQSQTSGAEVGTLTKSSSTRVGSRSHAHSNSLGTYKSTNDSWAPSGHSRSQSLSRTAYKLATSAAALCGLNAGDKSSTSPGDGKAGDLEAALRRPGTKVIHLQDQLHRERSGGDRERGNVVVITPTLPSAALAMMGGRATGVNGVNGVSPTPSGLTTSHEGIGVAISTPPPSSNEHREPILIPAHPYAQGSTYAYKPAVQVESGEHPGSPAGSDSQGQTEEPETAVNKHRHPVLVHPYSQPGHPYAVTRHFRSPSAMRQHSEVPPNDRMYAELDPGHIREIAPDEIQYSPYILTTPEEYRLPPRNPARVAIGHPYAGPAQKRTSELGFDEALSHTLRSAESMDSGLGASEEDRFTRRRDWDTPRIDVGLITADIDGDHIDREENQGPAVIEPSHHMANSRSALPDNDFGGASSSSAYSQSPHLPMLGRSVSASGHLSLSPYPGRSDDSLQRRVSHESSPPLSPRPINTVDDLERFRDIFYKPSGSSVSSDERKRAQMTSREAGENVPVDVSSQNSRSASGLTSLARQLSEELEELREMAQARSDGSERGSPRWGARHGGLVGPRPDDMLDDDPNMTLSPISYDSPPGTKVPLRLPIDTTFSHPAGNIPEDVESSPGSSILVMSPDADNSAQYIRVAAVDALSTPRILQTPQRFSSQLSVSDYGEAESRSADDVPPLRVMSQDSTLLSPISPDAGRSSYMTSDTGTSRMSGLSDFPVPPTQLATPADMPINQSYFSQAPQTAGSDYLTAPNVPRSALAREPSHDTFGRHRGSDRDSDVGEAF